MTPNSRLAIVILNWNGWHDTIECLESVVRSSYANRQIIIVDNGSSDDSVARITAWAAGEFRVPSPYIPDCQAAPCLTWTETTDRNVQSGRSTESLVNLDVVIVRKAHNDGFSCGYNVGVALALRLGATYIAVLNNDTFVHPDCLSKLVALLEQRPKAAMASCTITYYHQPKQIWYGGGKISWLRGGGVYWGRNTVHSDSTAVPVSVSFLSGCFWVIRATAIEVVGLLPEQYFIGGEESEYCVRMVRAGFELWYHPGSTLLHKVGRSYDLNAGRGLSLARYDKSSPSFMYGSAKNVYHWYRYKLLFQQRNAAPVWYALWIVIFRLYVLLAVLGLLSRVRHVSPRTLRYSLLRALHDHRRYSEITLQQLQAFEQEVANA